MGWDVNRRKACREYSLEAILPPLKILKKIGSV